MRVIWLVIGLLYMGLIVLNWNVRRELVTGLRKEQRGYMDKCKGYRWKFPIWGFCSLMSLLIFFFGK